MPSHTADEKLRDEFNQWAADGRGDEMEQHHISIAEQTFDRMNLASGQTVLDLGCGAGWASRIVANHVAPGLVTGIDVSDQMVERAKANTADLMNVRFLVGSSEHLPLEDAAVDKVLSIESFYYYADQDRALHEILRVLKPGGEAFILINLYTDNHYSLRWVSELKIPVHARSEVEYREMMSRHGFVDVVSERIPDLTPSPDEYSGKWFKSAEELKDFKRIGALLLRGKRAS